MNVELVVFLSFQMPLYAVGVAENVSPFAFGNACSLRFQWSISSEQVAKLKHPFHQVCSSLDVIIVFKFESSYWMQPD